MNRRILASLAVLLLVGTLMAQEGPTDGGIQFVGDYQTARKQALKTGKPLLVFFR